MAKILRRKKKKSGQLFGERLDALVLRVLWWLLTPLPVDWASATGRRVFGLLGRRSRKNRHVLANLMTAFPEKRRDEIERLAVEVWGNFGAVASEFAQLRKLTDPARNRGRLEIVPDSRDPAFPVANGPCIFVTAHCGNWELGAHVVQQYVDALDVIYAPQANPHLDRLIQEKRQALGCNFVSKEKGVRALLRALKSGRSVGLVVDTRIDEGPLLPFFGVETPVTTTPAWLALKTGCPIVPVQSQRILDARFRIIFHPALQAVRRHDETPEQAALRVTGDINALVESWIRARPADWMCTKRRWPKESRDARNADVATPESMVEANAAAEEHVAKPRLRPPGAS